MTTTLTPVCADFTSFAGPVRDRFREMSQHELYVADVDGDVLWQTYLAAFPEGTNPMFRTRTEHDCSTCKRFVRNLGKLVTIRGGHVTTVWGGLDLPQPYKVVAERVDKVVRFAGVKSVFRTKEVRFGEEHNYDAKTNQRYDHLHGTVATRHYVLAPDTARGEQDAVFQVLRRGLTEIRRQHLVDVIDLIESNGLYRGEEHKPAVLGFLELLSKFEAAGRTDLFVWEHLKDRNARFRNTVIGTLLTDLAEGKEFDQAVKAFETKVAPMNYKRPTAVITQGMVEKAVQTVTDLGLHGALARRYARLSDVSVNDVLFVDNSARGEMKDGIAALLESSVKKAAPDLKHAVAVTAASATS